MNGTGAPLVSIVAPCHNEGKVLREFHRRAGAAASGAAGDSYEIILVDDGSRDDTWEVIAALALADPHVRGLRLTRNFGQQPALTAGLSFARGHRVLLTDADLQDPPELLGPMMQAMDQGADVVYGQRSARLARPGSSARRPRDFIESSAGSRRSPSPSIPATSGSCAAAWWTRWRPCRNVSGSSAGW